MLDLELLRLGSVRIELIHLMTLLNVAGSLGIIYRVGRRRGLRMPGPAVAFGMLLLCVAGTRLLAGLIQIVHFRGHLTSYYLFRDEGLTILGGILVSLPLGFLYCRWKKIPFYTLAISCAFGLTVFTLLQRMICFLNGCCFGLPTDGPFGVHFPPHTDAGSVFPGEALHPTQLYTMAAYLGLLAFLSWAAPRTEEKLLFGVFMMFVGTERLLNQSFRWAANNDVLFLIGETVVTGHGLVAGLLLLYGLAVVLSGLWRVPAMREAAVS